MNKREDVFQLSNEFSETCYRQSKQFATQKTRKRIHELSYGELDIVNISFLNEHFPIGPVKVAHNFIRYEALIINWLQLLFIQKKKTGALDKCHIARIDS